MRIRASPSFSRAARRSSGVNDVGSSSLQSLWASWRPRRSCGRWKAIRRAFVGNASRRLARSEFKSNERPCSSTEKTDSRSSCLICAQRLVSCAVARYRGTWESNSAISAMVLGTPWMSLQPTNTPHSNGAAERGTLRHSSARSPRELSRVLVAFFLPESVQEQECSWGQS